MDDLSRRQDVLSIYLHTHGEQVCNWFLTLLHWCNVHGLPNFERAHLERERRLSDSELYRDGLRSLLLLGGGESRVRLLGGLRGLLASLEELRRRLCCRDGASSPLDGDLGLRLRGGGEGLLLTEEYRRRLRGGERDRLASLEVSRRLRLLGGVSLLAGDLDCEGVRDRDRDRLSLCVSRPRGSGSAMGAGLSWSDSRMRSSPLFQ